MNMAAAWIAAIVSFHGMSINVITVGVFVTG